MTQEERLDDLYRRHKRLISNRNLCFLAIMFIVFSMMGNISGAPFYYIAIMGLIIIGLVFVAIFGKKNADRIMVEIKELEASMPEVLETTEVQLVDTASEEQSDDENDRV